MTKEAVRDPAKFLERLGGLHDARLYRIEVFPKEKVIRLTVNDLNANFTETSDYEGERPCVMVFTQVRTCIFDTELSEGVRIDSADIFGEKPDFRLEVDLNLGAGPESGGRRSIIVAFEQLAIEEN